MASVSEQMRGVIRRLIRWAVVESAGGDTGGFPTQQVSYLGRAGKSAAWYPYGFHAVAEAGDLALLLAISGQTDSRAHLPGSPGKRPPLKPGEVIVYHPKTKSWVYFKTDGSIEVVAKKDLIAKVTGSANVTAGVGATVTAPTISLVGAVTVNGTLVVTGATTFQGTITDSLGVEHTAHVHRVPFSSGPGDTNAPENP